MDDNITTTTALALWAGVAALTAAALVWAVERPGPLEHANYAPAIVLAVAGAVLVVVSAILHAGRPRR